MVQLSGRGRTAMICVKLPAIFLLLAFLTVFASASPFELNNIRGLELTGRATHTGKHVGSACKTSSECYSKNCVAGKCQRQPNGGPCFKNDNCVSRSCDLTTGKCTNLLKPDAMTNSGADCLSGSSDGCFQSKLFGAKNDSCYDGDNYFAEFCARFPIGHACADTGDCDSGICKNGKCSQSAVGDACGGDRIGEYQCTGDQTCKNFKCILPAPRSQLSNDYCVTNSQCASNRCKPLRVDRDQNGVPTGFTFTSTEYPQCDIFYNGESGCPNTFECDAVSLCKNGSCQTGQPGDKCDLSQRCSSNICNLQGLCASVPKNGTLATGEPCLYPYQCSSNKCERRDITRYTVDDSPRKPFTRNQPICVA